MNQSIKTKIYILVLIVPSIMLLFYMLFSTVINLDFLFSLALLLLLPFSATALFLKTRWKLKFEDGTTKGDLQLLIFGTLTFMGILCGFFSWIYLLVSYNVG